MKYYPPIQLVDENDQPVGGASMDEIHKKGLLHRVVHIIVEDNKGNILLQKRGPTMATHPDYWDFSAGGHVDEGEDYQTAGIRELSEELGIRGYDLELLEIFKQEITINNRILNRFVGTYRAIVSAGIDLNPEAEEVSETKWFSSLELNEFITEQSDIITPGFIESYKRYYENHKHKTTA